MNNELSIITRFRLRRVSRIIIILGCAIGLLLGVHVWVSRFRYFLEPGGGWWVFSSISPQLVYVLVLVLLYFKKDAVAFVFSAGMALVSPVYVAFLSLLSFGSASKDERWELGALFLPAVPLALGWLVEVIASSRRLVAIAATTIGVFVCALIFYGIFKAQDAYYLAMLKERWRIGAKQELVADALLRMSECAVEYQKKHPETGFPVSISLLSESGDACLSPKLTESVVFGFKIKYLPRRSRQSARIDSYLIKARWNAWLYGNADALEIDGAGIVRRPVGANAYDFRFSLNLTGHFVEAHWGCLQSLRKRTPGRRLPEDLRSSSCLMRGDAIDATTFHDKDYRYKYVPVWDGVESRFYITARPIVYGETGMRSYYEGEDGILRSTLADREATANDPPDCQNGSFCK